MIARIEEPPAREDRAVRACRSRRGLILLGVGALTLAAAGCGQGQAEESGPAIQTVEAERRDLLLTAEATGSVEPLRVVELKSKASGEILRLHVDTGDKLEPGALVAEIDPRDVRNAHNQAKADMEVARARLDISRAQLERATELLEAGVITQEEFEARNLEHANAQAALVRAETNLELAEERLGDVRIRAPLAGTVLQKNVEEGVVISSAQNNVSGGTTLIVIANLDVMQVRTLVDETDVGRIQPGMQASVRVEAFPERTFLGEVEKIEPQAVVQQNVTMFPVIVRLDNQSGLLKPGMNAEVEVLVAERSNTLTVPNSAVVEPQEMAPAAAVLGLDPESIQLDRSAFAELRRQLSGGAEGGEAVDDGGDGAGATGAPASMQELRAKVQSGEISRDSARALFQQMRGAGGGRGGPGAGMGRAGRGAGSNVREDGRPAIAFVVAADGSIEPRPVLLGLNDWDYAEVLAGLEPGERVALIGAAQLQAQQQEFLNRIRSRRGGPF